MGKYIRGNVDEQLSLGTLASNAAVNAQFDDVVFDRTLISSLVGSWSLANKTVSDGQGPLIFGVMHSDYSTAELEEWIETTSSWNEGDLVQREVAGRKIRQIGVFGEAEGASVGVIDFNNGRPVKTKLNWILLEGQTLDLWVYNTGGNALATTVPVVRVNGHANLWPRG